MVKRYLYPISTALFVISVYAQHIPDAGRIQQEMTSPAPAAPLSSSKMTIEASKETSITSGGHRFILRGIRIEGATLFDEKELIEVLGDFVGQSYDLAGIKRLASRITEHYRQAGYLLAHTVIPPQKLTDGVVHLKVIEARYGQVTAEGYRASEAQKFLSSLQTHDIVERQKLYRAVLLLNDQPGVRVTATLRPGQEVGTSDLFVDVEKDKPIEFNIVLDNHGNRYAGTYRTHATLSWKGPVIFGDQINVHGVLSDEGLWQGTVSYDLPLGTDGLRGNISYAHTYYELGKEFASLQAHGTARTMNMGLSYQALRSLESNLNMALELQHKSLKDQQDAIPTQEHKHSDLLQLAFRFDRRGEWNITWGKISYSAGKLDLDGKLMIQDDTSRMYTRGYFSKWNIDVSHQHNTPYDRLSLFARIAGQWASKNLDSSESIILGGPHGIRAYPVGEANGDEGWLLQLEARYRLGDYEPFIFYDAGKVRINADNEQLLTPLQDNNRSIAGSGLGLRLQKENLDLEAVLAWRAHGNRPSSDTKNVNPRLWVSVAWHF